MTWLERTAVRYLQKGNAESGKPGQYPDRDTGAKIKRLELSAILSAAISGLATGTLIGGVEVWLNVHMPDAARTLAGISTYWSIFLGFSILVSALEIAVLYRIVLHRAGQMTAMAGLRLSGSWSNELIATGITRSVLDVPDSRKPFFGIDPLARIPRWYRLLATAGYRLKISATTFAARLILRRVLARAAVRVFIPMVAVIIYAAWNAIIIGRGMCAARLRTLGPHAVRAFTVELASMRNGLTQEKKQALFEIVADIVQIRGKGHPNFLLLLHAMVRTLEIKPTDLRLDSRPRSNHSEWPADEQTLLLKTATLAILLSGKPRNSEISFLASLYTGCGRGFRPSDLMQQYRTFLRDGSKLVDKS